MAAGHRRLIGAHSLPRRNGPGVRRLQPAAATMSAHRLVSTTRSGRSHLSEPAVQTAQSEHPALQSAVL